MLSDAYEHNKRPFVMAIDDWGASLHAWPKDREGYRHYYLALRHWLKDQEYVALVYVTGLLPVRPIGVESGLNMFWHPMMAHPSSLAGFVGLTGDEVRRFCEERGLDLKTMREWYGGYRLSKGGGARRVTLEVYNPLSVAGAVANGAYARFWGQVEELSGYLHRDYVGLGGKVARLMEGAWVPASSKGSWVTSYPSSAPTT